ncbi:hypothetical protein KF707C_6000 [Metapseudomonas furukawaii]|uniref:Uncharacterized protein n=1 Tax=Metapseudomonas furukawaii TaxID=1149133 RepID=A0AAD1BXD4_METFU|nr:hypothetical protein KF707C_6000 [Pseudomonas furukawaii]
MSRPPARRERTSTWGHWGSGWRAGQRSAAASRRRIRWVPWGRGRRHGRAVGGGPGGMVRRSAGRGSWSGPERMSCCYFCHTSSYNVARLSTGLVALVNADTAFV